MTTAQQSGEPQRDYSSPATWGDVEQVRLSLEARIDTRVAGVETQMAMMETRLEARIDTSAGGLKTQMAKMETRLEARIDTSAGGLETQMAKMETRLESQMARMETRLLRWSAGLAAAAGLAIIGFLVGVLQAVD